MKVLGIDTSCDETSVALVEGATIRRSVVVGQTSLHRPFGGVVPEIAARAHVERMIPALDEVLAADRPDLIAVTNRPGLIGPLLVGLSAAKSLALAHDLPIVGVHHLEAHVAAAYLLDPAPEPPFIALIASGGHTLLYHVPARGRYERLGTTIDDAPDVPVADLAASAQEAIADVLSFKAVRACVKRGVGSLVLGGGVAANTRLREWAARRAADAGLSIFIPPRELCTDNAAMIAARGRELYEEGRRDDLFLDADPYADE